MDDDDDDIIASTCAYREKCPVPGTRTGHPSQYEPLTFDDVCNAVTAEPSSPWTSSGSAHVTRSLRVTILYLCVREVHGQRARAADAWS